MGNSLQRVALTTLVCKREGEYIPRIHTDAAAGGALWFAMRVFNKRIFRFKDEIDSAGMESYMAMQTVDRIKDGRLVYEEKQIVPSLLFVRTDSDWLMDFKRQHFSDIMLYGDRPGGAPVPIPDKQMDMFILVTSVNNGRGLEFIGQDTSFLVGERVRVKEGIYKGAEGIVKRIRRDRKLLVAVEGVAVIAISHIPIQFLERIETDAKS